MHTIQQGTHGAALENPVYDAYYTGGKSVTNPLYDMQTSAGESPYDHPASVHYQEPEEPPSLNPDYAPNNDPSSDPDYDPDIPDKATRI